MVDLSGRVALVTAAAQGIGRATALSFAEAGIRTIATDVNADKLSELHGTRGIETHVLDVLDDGAIRALASRIGRVDILFNCAGIVYEKALLDSADADLDFGFDLNVKSMVRMIRAVLPGMIERGDGTIINMSSVISSLKAVPNRLVYATTKAAVIGLTKSVAIDYLASGIRCNAICPATVETPSMHDRVNSQPDPELALKAITARQPMGRVGSAQEVADLALYIAGAAYTTGQTFVIDGGASL